MTYSLDFRRKVMSIKEREGLGREEAARRFGIGVATLDRWAKRLEPQTTRNKPREKRADGKPVEEFVCALTSASIAKLIRTAKHPLRSIRATFPGYARLKGIGTATGRF